MTTLYPRPVPLVGDATSAAERAADPTGWGFSVRDREALAAVVAARRDVRRFRPDAVPADVLERVLTAAHAAPSVGHSQPWRFLLVDDPALRERAALLADTERLAQAAQLDPESGRRLLDLQLEGVREAPLGIVVCCDRRAPAVGVLGRATFPDADVWSCACAIENLWLAARAEGLGVGWVTLFRPADLAALVGLPDGVVTLGWLCLGWPDERSPAPGLERLGWSRRAPLSDVVLHNRWPADDVAPPPSRLAADPDHDAGPGAQAGPAVQGVAVAPSPEAVVGTRDSADVLLTPPSSLGVLDRTVDRVLALSSVSGRPAPTTGTLVLAVGRHRVVEHGVSVFAASTTDDVLAAARAGSALGVVAARAAGLAVEVVDAGRATGDLVTTDPLTREHAAALVERGRVLGAGLGGLVVLGEVGIGNTTVACALAAALLGRTPAEVVDVGAGGDTATVDRKAAAVGSALARWQGSLEPVDLHAALGGPELALLTGVVLGVAATGGVVVLDGLATGVAALVAVRAQPGVASHLVAGQRSREKAHALVLRALGLEPLLDLRLRAGEGVGGALAAQLLLTGLTLRASTARTG